MTDEASKNKTSTGSKPDKIHGPVAVEATEEPKNTLHLSEEELQVAELVDRANDLVALMRRPLDEYAAGERGLDALNEALWAACLHDRILSQINWLARYPTAATRSETLRLTPYEEEAREVIKKLAAAHISAAQEARGRRAAARGDRDRKAWKAYLDGSAGGATYPTIEPHSTAPETKAEERAEQALRALHQFNWVRPALSALYFGDEDTLACRSPHSFPAPPSRKASGSRPSGPQSRKADTGRAIR